MIRFLAFATVSATTAPFEYCRIDEQEQKDVKWQYMPYSATKEHLKIEIDHFGAMILKGHHECMSQVQKTKFEYWALQWSKDKKKFLCYGLHKTFTKKTWCKKRMTLQGRIWDMDQLKKVDCTKESIKKQIKIMYEYAAVQYRYKALIDEKKQIEENCAEKVKELNDDKKQIEEKCKSHNKGMAIINFKLNVENKKLKEEIQELLKLQKTNDN